jgi:serine protease Do
MSEQEFDYNQRTNQEATGSDNGCTYHGPAQDATYQARPQSAGQASGQVPPQYGNSGYQNGYNPYQGNQGYQYDPNAQKKQKKAKRAKRTTSMTTGKVVALGLCCALVGGCVGGGGILLGASMMNRNSSSSSALASNTTALVESSRTSALETLNYDTSDEPMTPAQVYAANVSSCVGISATVTTYNIWGYSSPAAVSGSGFVLTEDGYIVTNYHVVSDSDEGSIQVSMYDGTTYDADLVGYDDDNDIAVLKVDAEGLTPVVLGSSDDLSVGDQVIAIGNPLGELTFSLTSGYVSALNREVTLSIDSSYVTMNLIQTDAAINSGNSGGPLFNAYGEVIGITNAKYGSSSSSSSTASIDNIGFAIPIDTVQSIIESIIENGYVVKPYLGITLQDYSYTNADGETVSGAMIYSVVSGEAAEAAGLNRGDLITAIDGEEITSASDATTAVGKHSPGDTITITIDRNGETMDITATLGERQEAADSSSDSSTDQSSQSGQSDNSYGYGFNYGNGGNGGYSGNGGFGGNGGF